MDYEILISVFIKLIENICRFPEIIKKCSFFIEFIEKDEHIPFLKLGLYINLSRGRYTFSPVIIGKCALIPYNWGKKGNIHFSPVIMGKYIFYYIAISSCIL